MSAQVAKTELPNAPWLIPKASFPGTGLDFLGLRAANMEMMDECIPGISNRTSRLRCYSLIAWIAWKQHVFAQRAQNAEIDDIDATRFSEGVETLFAWSHKRAGITGIPGTSPNPPAGEVVPLRFTDWGRNWGNTSLMAPVEYGPSAKDGNGLGFIRAYKPQFFIATENGARIA